MQCGAIRAIGRIWPRDAPGRGGAGRWEGAKNICLENTFLNSHLPHMLHSALVRHRPHVVRVIVLVGAAVLLRHLHTVASGYGGIGGILLFLEGGEESLKNDENIEG